MTGNSDGGAARNATLDYRADIDGLRAVAVLAVVLFHAGVPGFSGGFVGVDVFFVISGFLITKIIAGELDTDRFSVARFYVRRIRRIFPALFAMILVTGLVAGCFFLPADFRSFGTSVVATAAFASNILFWRQDNYFDAPAELKPLLHTWSLAIEEQFYIVFPLLLVLVWRLGPRDRWKAVAILALFSFGLGVWATGKLPQAAFYLLPTRAWELLIGSLLALRMPRPAALPASAGPALGWCGLALIAAAILLLDKTTPFPGIAALLPTLGAALLLWAGAQRRRGANALLARPQLVFVGQISFSLYLWHWPVIVLLRYALARELGWPEIIAVIVLSFVLAVLSWRFVELPFRRPRPVADRVVFGSAAATLAGFLFAGAAIVAAGGIPQRLPDDLLVYAQAVEAEDDRPDCREWTGDRTDLPGVCVVGDLSRKAPSFAVIGDSHAASLLPAFDLAGVRNGEKGLVFIRHACRPALGVGHVVAGERDRSCSEFVAKAIAEIRALASIREVVLAARWTRQVSGTGYQQARSYYTDDASTEVSRRENKLSLIRGLGRSFDALARRRITIVGPIPENEFLPPMALAMADLFDRLPPRTSTSAVRKRNAPVKEVFDELANWYAFDVISPARRLCGESSCLAEIDGHSLYRDDDHLSAFGAGQLADVIDDMFEDDADEATAAPRATGVAAPR